MTEELKDQKMLGKRSNPLSSLEPPLSKQAPNKSYTSNDLRALLKSHFTLESLVGGTSSCECGASLSNNITIIDVDREKKICLDCLGGWKAKPGDPNTNNIVNYYVLPALTFPLFTRDWTARQELELLQGVQKFGIGNWVEVSHFVQGAHGDGPGCSKSPQKCADHYFTFYYKSREDYTPHKDSFAIRFVEPNASKEITGGFEIDEEALQRNEELEKARSKARQDEEMIIYREGDEKDMVVRYAEHRDGVKQEEINEFGNSMKERMGYNPYRGDFDTEPFQNAEKMIAEMEFCADDDDQEIELKMKVVDYYNTILNERTRRKRFVIERGFFDQSGGGGGDMMSSKRRSPEEREIINSMKIFARFNSKQDHEQLVEGLILEMNLKSLIDQLTFFKQKGFTNFAQINQFLEEEKKKTGESGVFSSIRDFHKNDLFRFPTGALATISNALRSSQKTSASIRRLGGTGFHSYEELLELGFENFEAQFLARHNHISIDAYREFKDRLRRMEENKKGEPLHRSDCDSLKSTLSLEDRFTIYEMLGFHGILNTEEQLPRKKSKEIIESDQEG